MTFRVVSYAVVKFGAKSNKQLLYGVATAFYTATFVPLTLGDVNLLL